MGSSLLDNPSGGYKQVRSGFAGEVDAHVTISRGQRRVLELIKRCDFDGTGCWPTQDELAFMSGYKRPYVNACVKSLEKHGLLRIEKRRRPGCKWTHNVYFVRDWSPNKRRGICNLRRAFQESRQRASRACSDTERTARPSRAQTPVVNPFLTASGTASAVVARRENELRRPPCMEPKRRHLHVADLTCPHCGPTQAENERLHEINRTLQYEVNRAMESEAAANEVAKAAGKEVTKLRCQLTKQDHESARLEQIQAVVACWRRHRPKASKAFGKPGSKSFQVIEKALVLMAEEDGGPVKACCEAIDGLHLAPFQEFDRWFAVDGPKRTLRNGLQYALGDEARIERCRAMAARASNVSLDAKFRAYEVSGQVHSAWAQVLMGELWTRPADREPRFEVDGVVTRSDGR